MNHIRILVLLLLCRARRTAGTVCLSDVRHTMCEQQESIHGEGAIPSIQDKQGLIGLSARPDKHQWTIDEAGVRKALVRIVARVERDSSRREELMQEALVNFWKQAERRPLQRLSWYLQSCKFHLLHFKRAGRSFDSLKHAQARATFGEANIDEDVRQDRSQFEEGLMSEVNAHDVISLLSARLGCVSNRFSAC